jgi:hypothetical protein
MEAVPEKPADTVQEPGVQRRGPDGRFGRADGMPGKVRLRSVEDLDRRTNAYQLTVDLIERVEADLGGAGRLSTAERQIIRHAALTGAMLEDLGTRWLKGQKVDPGLFATLSNSERRLYETIGLRRRPKDVTPDLRTYLRDSEVQDA